MHNKIVTVIGGTGFLGKQVVKHLARSGFIVNVVSRTPEQAGELKVLGPVGKVVLSQGNIREMESIKPYLKNSFAVVNLVGILYETYKQRFSNIQAQAAEKLAQEAKALGVEKFIQVSALGVDKAVTSRYARSKINGEKAVKAAFPEATIVRPSVIFGSGDSFINKFAWLSMFSPVLPLIGGGRTKFQPVYVDNVAEAIAKILLSDHAEGKIYELTGPKIYSFKEIIEIILAEIRRKKILLPVPFALAKLKASFLQLLPRPLLTVDQVRLLQYDNVASANDNNLNALGIKPTHLETVIPDYLMRYRSGKRSAL